VIEVNEVRNIHFLLLVPVCIITILVVILCIWGTVGLTASSSPINIPIPIQPTTAIVEPTPTVIPELRYIECDPSSLICHDTNYGNPDGTVIRMCDNSQATDPTKAEVERFILWDKTDEVEYNLSSWTCGNYMETVHTNAECVGIRCYMVVVSPVDSNQKPHGLVAFNTTDAGMVYVDCVGGDYWVNCSVGQEYSVESIAPTLKVDFDDEGNYIVGKIDILEMR
jgi:hypothetical protein